MIARSFLIALLIQFAAYAGPKQAPATAGDGFLCIGVWPNKILVMDESDHKVVSEIELKTGVPEWMMASYDKRRLIAITNHRNVEVIDLGTRKNLGHFTLVEDNHRPYVVGAAISPRGHYLYVILKSAVKEIDRFTLERARFYVVDLDRKKVAKIFDFPKEFDEIVGFGDAGFKVSDDEKLLYIFGDDILVYDLATFKQVDKIEMSKPLHPGMFPISFSGESDPNEEPGFVTSLFSSTDPVARRAVSGVVRVNLRTKNVELFPIGPSMPSRGRLYISPDKKTAYAVLVSNPSDPNRRPELCVFDLEARKLVRRVEFENRSRFTFMAGADTKYLYLYGPGSVIDIYNSDTLKLERTITVEGDITEMVVLRSLP